MNTIENIQLSDVHYFHGSNFSRYAPTPADFFSSEADKGKLVMEISPGWMPTEVVTVYKLSEAEKAMAVSERVAEHNALKARSGQTVKVQHYDAGSKAVPISLVADELLAAWEAIYMADGEIIAPAFGGVSGFRRNACVPEVNALFRRGLEGCKPWTDINVVVKVYQSEAERRADCIAENTKKTSGQRKLNLRDLFVSTAGLWKDRKSQADAGRTLDLKRGTLQKLWYLATVCLKRPTPEEREDWKGTVLRSPDEGQKDHMAAYSKTTLSELMGKAEEDNYPFKKGAEVIRAYLVNPWAGASKDPSMMKKTDIGDEKDRTTVRAVKEILNAVLNDDKDFLKKVEDFEVELNAVWDALSSGGKQEIIIVDAEVVDKVKAVHGALQKDSTLEFIEVFPADAEKVEASAKRLKAQRLKAQDAKIKSTADKKDRKPAGNRKKIVNG